MRKPTLAVWLSCLLGLGAQGQGVAPLAPPAPFAPACPAADAVEQVHLLGPWRATLESPHQQATVRFEKSRDYAHGVSGSVTRDGRVALLEGDVEAGQLELDESDDGLTITATWRGTVVEQSCGKHIKGIWSSSQGVERAFELHKLGSW